MHSSRPNLPGWMLALGVAILSGFLSALAVWAMSEKVGGV